jgi:hypothetical protein
VRIGDALVRNRETKVDEKQAGDITEISGLAKWLVGDNINQPRVRKETIIAIDSLGHGSRLVVTTGDPASAQWGAIIVQQAGEQFLFDGKANINFPDGFHYNKFGPANQIPESDFVSNFYPFLAVRNVTISLFHCFGGIDGTAIFSHGGYPSQLLPVANAAQRLANEIGRRGKKNVVVYADRGFSGFLSTGPGMEDSVSASPEE